MNVKIGALITSQFFKRIYPLKDVLWIGIFEKVISIC